MRTIYLKELKSGNFEVCEENESTIQFSTETEFKLWFKKTTGKWRNDYAKKIQIVKARYNRSITYFRSCDEILNLYI